MEIVTNGNIINGDSMTNVSRDTCVYVEKEKSNPSINGQEPLEQILSNPDTCQSGDLDCNNVNSKWCKDALLVKSNKEILAGGKRISVSEIYSNGSPQFAENEQREGDNFLDSDSEQTESSSSWISKDRIKFVGVALGIILSYVCFGLLQEKVTRSRYGDVIQEDGKVGEKFEFEFILVGILCLCHTIFAKGVVMVKQEKPDKTPFYMYICTSIFFIAAMVSSNMALRWIPYPTQVIGKSAKPIPVMFFGLIVARKRYPIQKYLFVFLIVVGVSLFMMKNMKNALSEEAFGLGEILVLVSLTMDGLIGGVEERVRRNYNPSAPLMMLSTNAWSTLILSAFVVCSGELLRFYEFVSKYPYVLARMSLLAVTSSIGQLFIFTMITSFGALACSVVTTTRKFFTVLFSVIFFRNALTITQWVAAILVFAALFADAFYGKAPPRQNPREVAA